MTRKSRHGRKPSSPAAAVAFDVSTDITKCTATCETNAHLRSALQSCPDAVALRPHSKWRVKASGIGGLRSLSIDRSRIEQPFRIDARQPHRALAWFDLAIEARLASG